MIPEPFDPRLKAAMEEMRQVCERYDIGMLTMLVSKTHSESRYHMPSWSIAQLKDDPGGMAVRLLSKREHFESAEAQLEANTATAHIFDQWRNWLGDATHVVDTIWGILLRHWDIESNIGPMHPHDIIGEAAAHDPINRPESRAERRRRERDQRKRDGGQNGETNHGR